MKKYKTILADPPWFESGRKKRGANAHYSLMKTEKIKMFYLMITNLAAEDCHLYLWVTNNFLPDGLAVMRSWGFKYITTITWIKAEAQEGLLPDIRGLFKIQSFRLQQTGLGQYFRGLTEHCLFGVKGRLKMREILGRKAQAPTLIIAPRRRHSEKPDEIFKYAEIVSYPPRIELFARKRRENWDAWGNELNNKG